MSFSMYYPAISPCLLCKFHILLAYIAYTLLLHLVYLAASDANGCLGHLE